MADEKLTYRVSVEGADQAERDMKDLADATAKVPDEVTVEAKAETKSAQQQLDEMLAEIHQVKTQAKALESDPINVDVDPTAARRLDDVGDAADHAKAQAVSSLGPLRDVSGGLGNLGTAGLDASESLLGLGDTLGALNPKLEGLGATLGKAGLVAGIAVLATAITAAVVDSFNQIDQRLKDTVAEIEIEGGKGTESLEAFADAADALRDTLKDPENWMRNLLDTFGLAAERSGEAEARMKAFNKVLGESPAAAAGLVENLRANADALGLNSDELDRMADKLQRHIDLEVSARLATERYDRQISALVEAQRRGIDSSDRSAEHLEDLVRDYDEAKKSLRDGLTPATDEYARHLANVAEAERNAADATRELDDERAKLAEHTFDVFNSQLDLQEQSARMVQAVRDLRDGEGDLNAERLQALREIERMAVLNAAANGAPGTAAYWNALIASLKAMLKIAPELAAQINQMIAAATTQSQTSALVGLGPAGAPPGAIPAFAEGGVVPGARGAPQLVQAHGGEVVLNEAQQRAIGGGTTVHLSLTFTGPVMGDPRAISRFLFDAIVAGSRTGLKLPGDVIAR